MFAFRTVNLATKAFNGNAALKLKSAESLFKNQTIVRNYRVRSSFKSQIYEQQPNSAGIKAMNAGQIAVTGFGALGIGALGYYGMGLSNELGAIDKVAVWPPYVKSRITATYGYFLASVGVTAASAVAFFRSPMSYRYASYCTRHPIMGTVATIAALIGSSTIMRSIPYDEHNNVTKHAMWLVNSAILGVALSPVMSIGGAIAMRAATITGGMIAGLSTIAMCAPNEKFLQYGGALGLGLGGVVMASLGSAFLPASSALAMPLYAFSLYGGLIIFSGLLLYDTQKIVRHSEQPRFMGQLNYDPINMSHMILMDAVNIFIRIAQILMMSGNRKK